LSISLVEFAYNVVNRPRVSPFAIVHGYSPHIPSDLIPLPPNVQVSQFASIFAQHIHDLHSEICSKIAMNNDSYKLSVDVHHMDISFEVGDFVMARIQPKQLPKHSHKNLHARAMSPYQIIKKLGSNA